MSPTVRAGLLFGIAATLAFLAGLFLPIPCVNIILAFGSVVALGWGAGYSANKWMNSSADRKIGRGTAAGAIGGVVTLILTAVLFLVLSGVILSIPSVRDQIGQALQQNPDAAQLNPEDIQAAAGVGFGVVGVGCGIVNFLLMLLGGLIGGATWKGAASTADYVPAGGSVAYNQPPAGGYIPQSGQQAGGAQQYNAPASDMTPRDQNPDEGGARVYDPNDPNRPPS